MGKSILRTALLQSLAAVSLIAMPAKASAQTGRWFAAPLEPDSTGSLRLTIGLWDPGMNTFPVRVAELRDLDASRLKSHERVPAQFALDRDAGTFTFSGNFADGAGEGTFSFRASSTYADKLRARGIGAPTSAQQFELARQDVAIAFVDELINSGMRKPSPSELVALGTSGLTPAAFREIENNGRHFADVGSLIYAYNARAVPTSGLPSARAQENKSTPLEGTWIVKPGRNGGKILQLNWSDGTDWSRPISPTDFSSVGANVFEIVQSAGTFRFKGNIDQSSAEQTFTFEPNRSFESRLRDIGITGMRPMNAHELKNLAFGYISTDAIQQFKAAGLDPLSLDDLIMMGIRQVSPEFVRSAQRQGLAASHSVKGIIDLKFGGGSGR